tara:strand:+ start:207 stop:908 length:702 start_codon:yes stop_codon:yes gene_type:complete
MSLGRRLMPTDAACTTDSADPFGDSSGVILYQLNSDGGTTNNVPDASGNHNGTASNITYSSGQIGNAAVFNGSSSFINTNYTLTTDTTFSFSWWMNADSPTQNHYIVNDGNGTVHDGSFAIYHNTSDELGMWIGANGSGYGNGRLAISGGLSGSWMHFAVSVNGSTATIYKNGSLEGTLSLTPHSTAGILTLIIGRLGHFNGFYFKGDLDQMRYFNKAISATEVGTLYAETAC